MESEGIEASGDVLSKRLQVKESEIADMGQRLDNCEVSLESPVSADGVSEQKMFLASNGPGVEEEVADQEFVAWFHAKLDKFKETISAREQVILFERLMSEEPRTLTDIASQFGISRERIRQIEGDLLDKLRGLLASESGAY